MNWRGVPSAPGYEVSDTGMVRNTRRARVLNPWAHPSGHLYINCGPAGRFQVHHLVLEAFGSPRPAGLECRHLDGNPANNNLSNLVWGTRSQNQADMFFKTGKYPKSAIQFEIAEHIGEELKTAPRGGRQAIAAKYGTTIHVVNHIAAGTAYRGALEGVT